ncbi:MAG: fluoride efflux transporter CrcB [Blastocatellia bacterium]|nr:fluoride efflux transporter CrcB [Blastocatellia bacterium]
MCGGRSFILPRKRGQRQLSKLFVVALGGALGAIARYWLGGFISSRLPMQFPLGTFIINATGSFIIGFFLTMVSQRITINPNWRFLIAVGFVGAYTTFSTFEYETFKLIEDGNILIAALNVILSLTLCFIAVWLGVTAARKFYIPQVAASQGSQKVTAENFIEEEQKGLV